MTINHRRLAEVLAASIWALGGVASIPAATPSQPDTGQLETILVTAQKRQENLQEVPITVTVVSQDQLDRQNVLTTTDLVRSVPALTATDEGVFQIRGIGTQGFGRSAEASVSVVLDGVVLGRALTNALYDLDHVEVLSGPQGMLFGKNSNAGVINVVTKAPVLKEYQAIGHVDFGDHDYVHSYVIGNFPLGDDAALRLSYHHDSTGHVVFNTLYGLWDHNTDDGVRLRLLWRPTDALTINVSGDYQKLRSNGVNGVADFAGVQVFTSVPPGTRLEATLAGCGIKAGPDNNRVCGNSLYAAGVQTGNTYGRENGGAALQLDYSFWRDLTLTSISAYRKTLNEDFDVDGDLAGEFGDTLPQNLLDRNLVPYWDRTFSEELRVQSPSTDVVNFIAGLYYSKTDSRDRFDQSGKLGAPLPGLLEFRRRTDDSISQYDYAAFGQINYRITPQWQAFVGGRVTHDHLSDYSVNSFPNALPGGPFIYLGNTGFFSTFPINTCTLAGGNPDIPGSCPAGTSLSAPATLQKTGLSGKAGLQYQLDPSVMLFASVARGYKGPFINEAASFPIQPSQLVIQSEYPLDFELGVKSTLWDRMAVNATLFHNRIGNFQTTIYVPPSATQKVANFIQGNAPYAISEGVELTFFGQPLRDFNVNGGVIYNDAYFDKGFLVNCGKGPCPALHQLPFAPVWKATFSGEYHRHLGGPVEGFVEADVDYSSTYHYGSAPGFPGTAPHYFMGARTGVRSASGKWSVAVFCRNCLDKRYPILAEPDGFGALDGGATATAVPTWAFLTLDSYRVLGVTLDARF